MQTWLIYAILAAMFGGINAILVKLGVQKVNSHVATAFRTIFIVIFSWIVVFALGSHVYLADIDGRTWFFLIASGLSTGGSWLAYFYALKFGSVSNVSPLKKSSTVLTIILAFLILGEPFGIPQAAGIGFIILGTLLMLKKKDGSKDKSEGGGNWLLFGLLSAVFASFKSIFGAIGIVGVDANLGNAVRVIAVLFASIVMVFVTGNSDEIKKIDKKSARTLILSALATAGSWLFFFRALQLGPASVIVPIDKLSIVLNIAFARLILKEKQPVKRLTGLAALLIGTAFLIF